jgi:hypothetical protein
MTGRLLLHSLAEYTGGELWSDGRLCFETVEGGTEDFANPFPLKNLEKNKAEPDNSIL